MSLFGFPAKRREREKDKTPAEDKRATALIEEIYDWVCEDYIHRVLLVCIAAVTEDLTHHDIDWTETQWRSMMTEQANNLFDKEWKKAEDSI